MSHRINTAMPASAGNGLRKPEEIGVIGVGLMGIALAETLLAGGFAVAGWDINPHRSALLLELGGHTAHSAADVVARCDRVLLSLPDINVVESVLESVRPQLRSGQTIIDTTTSDPDRPAALGKWLADLGVAYLDATVSGSSAQVRRSEVILMVGGPKETFARCQDLFRLFSKRAVHTGVCGSGSKMKLVTNLVLGLNRAALAEGLALARAMGLSLDQTLHVLMESMAYSRIMDTKGNKMIQGDFRPQAKLSQHLKDVRLILDAGAQSGTNLPLSAAHEQLLECAEALGFGQSDNSAIFRAFDALPKLNLP